ncbi:MAG: FG-GAP-like repeat-containing protein [Candidatus Thermoplasmatota archaeon]|nr:FG-GAP-like repeat-containing protein [Candidatus Thermoplasmatota archaeon]
MRPSDSVLLLASIMILSFMFTYSGGGDAGYELVPLSERAVPNFMNVTESSGLSGVRGDSFAWGDWNNDGYQDLLVKGSRLFKNNGPPDYTFTEVTQEVGLVNSGYSVFVDLDNDGYLDIFSVGHPYDHPDSVWLNSGPPDFRFRDVSHLSGARGVDDGMPSLACGAGDIDQDGYLDIYVVNWRDDENVKYPDVLWKNEGGGKFIDITDEAGIVDWNPHRQEPNAGMGVNFGDYNDDGWIDIYVSNYLITPNYLFENQGDSTFEEVAHERGCAGEPTQGLNDVYYGHTAGSQWADHDNDGDLDLWCSNLAHKDPYRTLICDDSQLWRNDGEASGYSFTNIRDQTGIPTNVLGDEELFFGIAWGDVDNDGRLDMFVPQVKNYIDYAYSYLFLQNDDGTFTDVSEEAGLRIWDCVGGAWCDYDNDGDLDLVVDGKYPYENGTYGLRLYQNQGVSGNGFIHVDLEGTLGNPSAVGARVKLFDSRTKEHLGMREVEGGTAGHSFGPSLTVEFGLGSREGPFDLEIRWPTNRVQYIPRLVRNSRIEVKEPSIMDLAISCSPSAGSLYEGEELVLDVRVENIGGSYMRGIFVDVLGESEKGPSVDHRLDIGDIPAAAVAVGSLAVSTKGMGGELLISAELVDPHGTDEKHENDRWLGTIRIGAVNSPPSIISFDIDPDMVLPGEWVNISVHAVDPDGDALEYVFSSEMGNFLHEVPTSPNAYWLSPSGPEIKDGAIVSLQVSISDGRGGADTASRRVTVQKRSLSPVISELFISSAMVKNDGYSRIRLEARISHGYGPDMISRVEADLSAVGGGHNEAMYDTGTGGDRVGGDGTYTIMFSVPGSVTGGLASIEVRVHDQDMNSAAREITVTVLDIGDTGASDKEPDMALPILAAVAIVLLILAPVVGVSVYFLDRNKRKG